MENLIDRQNTNLFFDPEIPPVLTVSPGDVVIFECNDDAYRELANNPDRLLELQTRMNRVTGPLAVSGALPGDALRVDILKIEITRVWAAWFPEDGAYKTDTLQIRQLHFNRHRVILADNLSIPLNPMIGCLGVAPAAGRSSSFVPIFPWGGNMDLPQLQTGASIFLPVQIAGALLSIGDLHAAMGSGEPMNVGLEAGGIVTVRVDVVRGQNLESPRIRLNKSTFFLAIGASPEEARSNAIRGALNYLTLELGMSPFRAFTYASACLALHCGGPAGETLLAEIPDPDR